MSDFSYSLFFWFIVILSISSIIFIKLNPTLKKYNYPILFILVALAGVLTWFSEPSLIKLGIKIPTLLDYVIYSGVTALVAVSIFFANSYSKKSTDTSLFNLNRNNGYLVFYIVISAPVQEFLFRSFLYYSLDYINMLNIFAMALLSSLLFGIAHLVFNDKYFVYSTFILGLLWGIVYYFFPNLLLITVSHAIIGLYAYYQGLIKKEDFIQRLV